MTMEAALKRIGIVGVSKPGAELCAEAIRSTLTKSGETDRIIGPEYIPFEEFVAAQRRGDRNGVAKIILKGIRTLTEHGADFAIIPANSAYIAIAEIQEKSPIPVLNLVQLTVEECRRRNWERVAVLGVGFTMESKLFDGPLSQAGIDPLQPNGDEQKTLNRIIYGELVHDRVEPASVETILSILQSMKERGCEEHVDSVFIQFALGILTANNVGDIPGRMY